MLPSASVVSNAAPALLLADGGLSALFGAFLCPCMVLPFSLLVLAFWIWMLVDCVKNEPSEGNDKIIWVLVIVLLQGLGALIYFLVRRSDRIRIHGR